MADLNHDAKTHFNTGGRAKRAKRDPLPDLVVEWRKVSARFIEEGEKPGAGSYDTPECLLLASQRGELGSKIPRTAPQSFEGAVALLDWADEDGLGGETWHPDQLKAQRAAIAYLKGLAA